MKQKDSNPVPTTVLILGKTSIVLFHFQTHGCLSSASYSMDRATFYNKLCYFYLLVVQGGSRI